MVLFEGLPGTGKSTAAHHAILAARASSLDVIWNYEEEREHPVALFRDEHELGSIVDAVFNGRHQDVITRAVQLWSRFGNVARQGEAVRFLDGYFFGSLG